MCNFFSAIITKNDIIYDPQTDMHEDLIKKARLDDTTLRPDFVRVEINPIDGDIFNHDMNNWQFKIDQDLLPVWWTEDFLRIAKERTKQALQDVFGKIIFINVKNAVITNQRAFLKNSSVEAWGNSSVVAWGNSSVVAWGNSSVEARDNSSVEAWDNASVVAWDNASVVAWDNSSVEARGNSSVVIPLSKTINIKSVQDNAVVKDLSGDKPKLIVSDINRFDIVKFDEGASR